jgi:hypothetical protein
MAIEIVDFPIKNGGSFHCYVNVYQRVPPNGWFINLLRETVVKLDDLGAPPF